MGMANSQTPTMTDPWGINSPTSATTYTIYYVRPAETASNYKLLRPPSDHERLFKKGKFFAFESSMEFRRWFGSPKTPVKAAKARHGFQQLARLPNYRKARTR